jgi:segregation and condensation protein A
MDTPLAIIHGTEITAQPPDLHIPPEALRVFLENFEGPLDLLLYLIQKHGLDILDIPITEITRQYLSYIDLMQNLQLDLAAEYLLMATLLLEIKSRLLLPKNIEDDSNDPRIDLVKQLQEYARYKKVAQDLNNLPQIGRDTFLVEVTIPDIQQYKMLPQASLDEMLSAMQDILLRMELYTSHHIKSEVLSVRERMTIILNLLKEKTKQELNFYDLFTINEGRTGAIVALLALLELSKEILISIEQENNFAPIILFNKKE